MNIENIPRTLWWQDGEVYIVDQSRLPLVGDVLVCAGHKGVIAAIAGMAVRGAPALGVVAAMGVALWASAESELFVDEVEFLAELDRVADEIAATRPTAVNLVWGAERMKRFAHANAGVPLPELRELLVKESQAILEEDEARNRAIGANGAALLPEDVRVLTHCNAGSLATAYYGTALGVIFAAMEQDKIAGVWVDETRPLLQGARLTAWELLMAGVPCRLITDGVAASIMRLGMVDVVIVGADRIAANGDVANKIGTYGLAVLCKEHGIPFYVAAPTSTIDLTLSSGDDIFIEQRDTREVEGISFTGMLEPSTPAAARAFDSLTAEGPFAWPFPKGHEMELTRKGGAYQLDGWVRVAPIGVEVYNPAFDVTPADYVTAIITESGVVKAPYTESLGTMCIGSGAIHEFI
jgi:methylthioribose-1-phosphate isomerase